MTRALFLPVFVFGFLVPMAALAENQPAVPTLPPPPQIEGQIELPKTSPMDRQKSTAAVKALQVMEAQKSGMMCQMMRQMAMQEKNPQTKMMMFMMANQSCDSSEASKKAAEENDKNRKLISQEDVPKMQKLKASAMPLDFGTQKGSDETQNLDAFKVRLDENFARSDEPLPSTSSTALINALTAGQNGGAGSQVVSTKELADAARETAGGGGAGPSMSSLPGIPNADGKSGANGEPAGGAPAGGGAMALGGGGAGGAGAGADGSKQASTDGTAVATAARKSKETDAGAGGGGGGESSAPPKAGNDAFEALLAQMLGGPPAAGEENGFNAGETVSMAEQTSKSLPTTNIFEYASLRYRRLAATQRVVAQSKAQKEAKESKAKAAPAKADEKEKAPAVAEAKDAKTVASAERKPASVTVEAAATDPKRAALR